MLREGSQRFILKHMVISLTLNPVRQFLLPLLHDKATVDQTQITAQQ
jgi:hypothetical protein